MSIPTKTQQASTPYLCIPLRGKHGGVAYVSETAWPLIDNIHWYLNRFGYAQSYKYGSMHRRVMAAEGTEHIDHINSRRHDNRYSNLRVLNAQLNRWHTRKKQTQWPYKGIRFIYGKWTARITFNKQGHHLGVFNTAEEAARAYDRAARKAFKHLAVCNFEGGE